MASMGDKRADGVSEHESDKNADCERDADYDGICCIQYHALGNDPLRGRFPWRGDYPPRRVQLEARREQLALRLQAEARPAGDVVRFARALARL